MHVQELAVLEAMRRVGSLVPKRTTAAKQQGIDITAAGVLCRSKARHVFTVIPPCTGQQAHISLWGFGKVAELDRVLEMST